MLPVVETMGAYLSLGLIGGIAINRPAYVIGYATVNGIMTIAMGILFGRTGNYIAVVFQVIQALAKIADIAKERVQQQQAQALI